MAVRSIWTGTISFGMVSIPAKLHSGTSEAEKVSFHQYHRECGTRLKMPKVCPKCATFLETADIQKGYELSEEKYVPIEDSDMKSLPLKSLKVIEVESFVDPDEINPVYLEKPYFVSPQDVGIKAFEVLHRAMGESGLVAVAKLCYREREHLCVLRPIGRALLLQTLYYASELKSVKDVEPTQMALVTEKEVEMATQLVKHMKAEFNIESYRNEYNDALTAMIEAKMDGTAIPVFEAPQATDAFDLEAMLRASIESIAEIDTLGKDAVEA
jgi:DNA end-binding protein Ku